MVIAFGPGTPAGDEDMLVGLGPRSVTVPIDPQVEIKGPHRRGIDHHRELGVRAADPRRTEVHPILVSQAGGIVTGGGQARLSVGFAINQPAQEQAVDEVGGPEVHHGGRVTAGRDQARFGASPKSIPPVS